METISFQGMTRNYYHTIKEHSISIDGQFKRGNATITGFTKHNIEVGDIFNIAGENFEVLEILERRNHAGTFINEQDKIDSFFRVETKFQRLIAPK